MWHAVLFCAPKFFKALQWFLWGFFRADGEIYHLWRKSGLEVPSGASGVEFWWCLSGLRGCGVVLVGGCWRHCLRLNLSPSKKPLDGSLSGEKVKNVGLPT